MSGARFSSCGLYRYSLWRTWDAGEGRCLFVMLNPSTADASEDDPTIRRCIGFAKRWGYSSLEVANIFAWRSTDPFALYEVDDPVGSDNDVAIFAAAARASIVIAAWGKHGTLRGRDREVMKIIRGVRCLKLNKDGTPAHPLYLAAATEPKSYEGRP